MHRSNPYVGPRSFTRKEADRFFGREREARDLLSLVMSERLALFYAQSGAGKTSLLHTRLIPDLEEQGRAVLPVGRVSGGLSAQAEAVKNIFVFSLLLRLEQGGAKPAQLAHLSLSVFLRGLVSEDGATYRYEPSADEEENAAADSDAPVCVLIVDQFEEILTQHLDRWQERAAFFRQLNQAMQDDPKLSVVLALREDYVAGLEPYAPLLAGRLRARFHMERMERQAALAAVAGPAQQHGRPFAPGAAELLVDNLSLVRSGRDKAAKPGQHIEPVQLQVVCFQLWENVAAGECITAADVQAAGSIDRALADFYEQAVAEAVRSEGVSELLLRQWVDRKLITPAGTRGMVFQGETDAAGLDNRAVRLLEDRFLLRAESRAGAVWYELVHDRFVEPIMQANRAWLEAQGPLLRDAQIWQDSNRTYRGMLYTGEKLKNTLAGISDLSLLEPVVAQFLEHSKGRQAHIDEKKASRERELNANRKFRTWFRRAAVVAVLAAGTSLWAGWATYKARTAAEFALTAKQETEKQLKQATYNFGLALSEKGELAENTGSRLRAHLYSLYAIDRLSQQKGTDTYREAVIRALANPVPLPAFRSTASNSHQEAVTRLVFSPDDRFMASASWDKTIRLWDAVTGRLLKILEGHTERVYVVAFSPDGRIIASGSKDKTIRLWDAATGSLLKILEGHGNRVNDVAFSPDGRTIASASWDKTIGLWDAATGHLLKSLEGHEDRVYGVAFSPDGHTIVSGSKDKTLGLWDIAAGKRLHVLEGHKDEVNNVAFSPDGRILASGSDDKTVGLWDASTGKSVHILAGHEAAVYGVAFSPDGRIIASGSKDKTVRAWDVATGGPIQSFEGYENAVPSVAFSSDGSTIASGAVDKSIVLWDAAGRHVQHLEGHRDRVYSVVFSPDGHTLASGSQDKTVKLWDTTTDRCRLTLAGAEDDVLSVAFSPDGRIIASGSRDKDIRLYDVDTGSQRKILTGHKELVASVAFSPDGHTLASGSQDKIVRLWDIATGKCVHTFSGHGNAVNRVDFSFNGQNIISGSQDKTVKLWDIATGRCVHTFIGHEDVVYSVAFSPDGRTIASGSEDKTFKLWDIVTGRNIHTLAGHDGHETDSMALAFSPDGRTLAAGSCDNTVDLWDVATGRCRRTLADHRANVLSVAFSPDGKTVASGLQDSTIGLWDLEDNLNEFSGISLDANGEYKIDLNTLPYKLEGLDLKPIEQKNGPDQPARWSKYHPFHWLPQAEAGDSNAMLQLGIIYDRNNDLARALHWYGQAIKAGNKQAEEQQSRLLHWLENKDNWQTVPGPFRDAFCKAKEEFELPEKVAAFCSSNLIE